MLFDLNVPWPVSNYSTKPTQKQLTNLKNVITTLYTLGYTHIAINFTLGENFKIPNGATNANPIQIEYLRNELKHLENLKLFTRITLTISDPGQTQGFSKIQSAFDIKAVQPLTERALQLVTINLDIDLISFNMGSRLPFFLKHKTICSAVDKGIKFEICYSPMISGPAGYVIQSANENMSLSTTALLVRKNFFSNSLQLIRASRSRGLIVSSGATEPLQARNSNDILTLLETLGLDNSKAKRCVTGNAENVLISGRLRVKSNKQTILIDNDNSKGDVLISNDKEDPNKKGDLKPYKKRLDETPSGRLLKKTKI